MMYNVYVNVRTGEAGYQGDLIIDGATYEDPTVKQKASRETRHLRYMRLGSRAGAEFMGLSDSGRINWLGNPIKVRGFLQESPTMSKPLAHR